MGFDSKYVLQRPDGSLTSLEDMFGKVTSILHLGCGDGAHRRQRGKIIHHQLRHPGGPVLWEDLVKALCSATPEERMALLLKVGISRPHALMIIAIIEQQPDPDMVPLIVEAETRMMIGLKNPDLIFLHGHNPCGAAKALGYTHEDVVGALNEWATMRAPTYKKHIVTVTHDNCPHGTEHGLFMIQGIFSPEDGSLVAA